MRVPLPRLSLIVAHRVICTMPYPNTNPLMIGFLRVGSSHQSRDALAHGLHHAPAGHIHRSLWPKSQEQASRRTDLTIQARAGLVYITAPTMRQCCRRTRTDPTIVNDLVDETVWSRPMTRAQRQMTHGTDSMDEEELRKILEDEPRPIATREYVTEALRRRQAT